MERIIFRAKAGEVTLGDGDFNRSPTEGELIQMHGIICQDDFAEYSKFKDKLESGYMHFIYDSGVLYTITTYSVKEDLTNEEIEELKTETQGQWFDGIGEGFEQFPCSFIGEDEVYISPWYSGQVVETFIDGTMEFPLRVKANLECSILQFATQGKEMLKFMPNGDVFVYGRLATNDMDIVEGIRAFLRDSGYMKPLVDINPVEEGPQDI